MNDYLDTLLACTLRPQETIQPRRRGRYEPLNYSRGLAMAPPLDPTGSEAADLVEEEVSRIAPSSPMRAPPAPIGPLAVKPSALPQTGEVPHASAPKTAFLGAPASPPATGRNLPPVGLEPTPSSMAGSVQAGEDAGAPRNNGLEPTSSSAPKPAFLGAPASPPAIGRNVPPVSLEPTPSSITGPVQAGEDAGAPRDRRLELTSSSVTGPVQAGEDAGAPRDKRLEPTSSSAPKPAFLGAPASPPATGRNLPPVGLEPTSSSATGPVQAGEDAGAPRDRRAPVVKSVVSPLSHPERQPAAIAGNEPLTPALQPRPVSPAPPRLNPVSQPAFGESSNLRAAEAPTIQVTIGRIEVRATPPAAPVPKPRPASPTLSLDDYLRQRNEGRR